MIRKAAAAAPPAPSIQPTRRRHGPPLVSGTTNASNTSGAPLYLAETTSPIATPSATCRRSDGRCNTQASNHTQTIAKNTE